MLRQPLDGSHATASPGTRAGGPEDDTLRLLPPMLRTFSDGMVVAGRYRVVRFIAEGGRGEVYEVEDLSLHERVLNWGEQAQHGVLPLHSSKHKA